MFDLIASAADSVGFDPGADEKWKLDECPEIFEYPSPERSPIPRVS